MLNKDEYVKIKYVDIAAYILYNTHKTRTILQN